MRLVHDAPGNNPISKEFLRGFIISLEVAAIFGYVVYHNCSLFF